MHDSLKIIYSIALTWGIVTTVFTIVDFIIHRDFILWWIKNKAWQKKEIINIEIETKGGNIILFEYIPGYFFEIDERSVYEKLHYDIFLPFSIRHRHAVVEFQLYAFPLAFIRPVKSPVPLLVLPLISHMLYNHLYKMYKDEMNLVTKMQEL